MVFLLFFPILGSVFDADWNRVYAGEIDEAKAYQGLALSLFVFYLFKHFDDGSDNTFTRGKSDFNYNNDELYWLAKVVNAEARGEPYRGQVAVAAVVLNRVKSDQFPDTIYSVIYQKGQFSSVADGQINLKPNATASKAAREALEGSDPSYGALYFYNSKTSSPVGKAWLDKRPRTVVIGNHAFAK